MPRQRLELSLSLDPQSVLDMAQLPSVVAELKQRLLPQQWAVLELLALEVERISSVDRETRRSILALGHRE